MVHELALNRILATQLVVVATRSGLGGELEGYFNKILYNTTRWQYDVAVSIPISLTILLVLP